MPFTNVNMKLIPWVVRAFFVLVFAIAAQAQPYITPYQPGGWSDKVVITTNPNSTTDTSPLYTTNEIYVDWSVINSGNAQATTAFDVDLYTNSVYLTSWSFGGLPQGSYGYVADPGFDVGRFPAGTNTVEIVADPTDVYDNPT